MTSAIPANYYVAEPPPPSAADDLVAALKNMPGPLWDFLIAPHRAFRHDARDPAARPVRSCVPCAYDAITVRSGNMPPGQFRDPAEVLTQPETD